MSTLLSVSIAALAGLLMTRVFNLWRLPDVTAYLVAGVLIGPYVLGSMHITGLGLVSAEAVSSLQLVSEVALGFIAFSIGNEFRLEDLKSTGCRTADGPHAAAGKAVCGSGDYLGRHCDGYCAGRHADGGAPV